MSGIHNTINLPTASAKCSKCGANIPHFVHQVRLLGILRRLCTSCVLRLHPASFCPVCFDFYGDSPPSRNSPNHVACSNCSSFAHSHCTGDILLSSYLCPPCKDSSLSFFHLKDNKIDKRLAQALLCAASISAASMKKAVTVAWAEAERKSREAAVARKRAKEAIEHLQRLTEEENARKEENENGCLGVVDEQMDDADGDGDIDVDLVRHLEDSLADN